MNEIITQLEMKALIQEATYGDIYPFLQVLLTALVDI